ncbi:MAG: hypothetical protein RL679_1962 [Bacteroidota bacterium]|jgi:hypothetical protein
MNSYLTRSEIQNKTIFVYLRNRMLIIFFRSLIQVTENGRTLISR